ncbi:MAG: hypothetical protein WC415_01955 [Patescibacteria group bacterium]|jgi:hypothetical protein
MKNKKIIIVFSVIFIYLLVGLIIYFIGGETRNISLYERISSVIIVMIGWPLFLIGKIFF